MIYNRGFTLIELLVVISIISLLSSITLATVNTARDRAANAAIKQQLSAFQTQASLLFSDNGNFDSVCVAGTRTHDLFTGAFNASRKADNGSMCLSSASGPTAGARSFGGVIVALNKGTATPGEWAVTVQLRDNTYFCVDSTGIKRIHPGPGRSIDNSPLDMSCL